MLVQHYLERTARRLGHKTALVCAGKRLTYEEIETLSLKLAVVLARLGVRNADRVIILLENSVESVASLFGILKCGAVFIMLNASIKSKKLQFILQDSGAKVIITSLRHAQVLEKALCEQLELQHIIWCKSDNTTFSDKNLIAAERIRVTHVPWAQVLDSETHEQRVSQGIDVDLAAIIYTSGSTGEPKGIMSAHCNIVAAATSIMQYLENNENDIILDALPLAFDYGLYQVIMTFAFGGTLVLEPSFAYPHQLMAKVAAEKVTGLPVVPTMLSILLGKMNPSQFDLRSLRYISNTAAHLSSSLIKKLRELFPWINIYAMYGLTECKRVSYLPPKDIDRKSGSVGLPIPNTQVFIVDPDGKEIGPGQVGELVVRGSHVMQGYWNAPDQTARTFRAGHHRGDVLLYSGDLFKKDEEGYLYFVSRKDDLIKTKGERVSPKEIENALCDLEGVAEAAVIGVPDDVAGQAIAAFIAGPNYHCLTSRMVFAHCRKHLEPFMIPTHLYFTTSLPRTANGKIDKRVLQLMAENDSPSDSRGFYRQT